MTKADAILPGAVLGVMGSGQLGRMFAIEARKMGYRVHTLSPDSDSPTGQIADREVTASYDDEAAVRDFAKGISVLTFEFENVPSRTIEWAAEHCIVRPAGRILHICQHRLREKEFLAGAGLPVAPFRIVNSADGLIAAAAEIGLPGVLKTAAFGYDGKGQRKLMPGEVLTEAWMPFEGAPAVLEGFVRFEREISVLVCRGVDGVMATWPVCENEHANHILDITYCPARISESVASAARVLAERVALALDLVGVLAVEMFLLADGSIVINELAPRPHNSGHFSFDASVTSQFAQQVRTICGLPLGSTDSMMPSAMSNLLGDVWLDSRTGTPDWAAALAVPGVHLHLYGKAEPKRGRKMGHITATASDVETAAKNARLARAALVA